MVMGWTGKQRKLAVRPKKCSTSVTAAGMQLKATHQFCLFVNTESLLTALEAAMAVVSGPRSPPPFNSPPSLLLSSSSVTDTAPGPFFFFSLARIDDSLSGKGGISSRTVA